MNTSELSTSNNIETNKLTDFVFSSNGLHVSYNVRHILPKIDEIRILMSNENSPHNLGLCETFLRTNNPDSQVSVDGYNFFRKDHSETKDKYGGGLLFYFKLSLNIKRRQDQETSNIETLWTEVSLPNSKPFLICSVYRPPSACSDWVNQFEEELSIAQTTGLEFILMGDINIDITHCINTKWMNLIQLFDLTQLVSSPTRITQSSSTIIDHIYTSNPENITATFVPDYSISDHFPICLSRKVNAKISKPNHITTSYRCFKKFDEGLFLTDLSRCIEHFKTDRNTIDDDFSAWHSVIIQCIDKHAPIKLKRVKSSRLPAWYVPEIGEARKLRDKHKHNNEWSEYKKYRNKTRTLIRNAKCKHFTNSSETSKSTSSIWKHLSAVNKGSTSNSSNLPDELLINNEHISDSNKVASKLNEYLSSIAQILNKNCTDKTELALTKLTDFVNNKVPDTTYFNIPYITTEQVLSVIKALNASKATGLDGIGPKIMKLAANCLSPGIADLINKSIDSWSFPSQMKNAKVFPIYKGGQKTDPSNYRPISILPTISKNFERHVNKHLMNYLNKYNVQADSWKPIWVQSKT